MSPLDPRNWPALLQAACSAWLLCTLVAIPLILHDLDAIARGRDDSNNE